MNKFQRTNFKDVRRTLTKSRSGFQRILRGPKQGFIVKGVVPNKYLMRFASGIGEKKFKSTPFKIIGIRM